MAKQTSDVVVINDQDVQGAGAVVFWSLSGPTSYDALEEAWSDHDLPEDLLLNKATPAAAMRSSMKTCATHLPPGTFIRKLDKLSFAVVREIRDGDDAQLSSEQYFPVLKIGLTVLANTGRVHQWERWPKTTDEDTRDSLEVFVAAFRARFKSALQEVSIHNFDWWTKRVMSQYVHTINLGERGKPFYVSPSKMDEWATVRAAFEQASTAHKFRQIPAMRSEDCAEAVLDACLREVGQETQEIYTELDVEDEDMLGRRALETRKTKLDRLLVKMESFESILGPKIETLREEIEDCKATVVEVTLTLAEGDDDG